MREKVSDATLVGFVLDELDETSAARVRRAAANDERLAREISRYREILDVARLEPPGAGPSEAVLSGLLAAQASRSRPWTRRWTDLFVRLTPVAGTLALALFFGTGLSQMGDALEPQPIASTGTAPSDALLVASGAAARRVPRGELRHTSPLPDEIVAWDSLRLSAMASDTGATDSL